MSYTRQEIIEKIKSNDAKFFQKVYFDWKGSETGVDQKTLWELNWGDGNDWFVAMKLTDFDIDIFLEGYYSSQGDSEFDTVSFGKEFEFMETRWRKATKAELRDMRLDILLED